MRLYGTLLVLLVAMCLVAAISIITPESEGARGVDHPTYSSMKHGGSGADRHADILWLNWGFGALSILVSATLIAIGASKGTSLRGLGPWLGLTTAGCVVAWTLLVLSYRTYMTDASPALFLALPSPSAWMLYALLPTTTLLTLFYVVGFKRWILSEDDLAAYEQLLATRKTGNDGSATAAADKV